MKTTIVSVIFILNVLLSSTTAAHEYTQQQQKKIEQIQQSVNADLAAGEIERARSQLEEVSSNFHSKELELAMVQTLMQNGEYRHALSTVAHIQAEHPDFSDATLMYAWLLTIGGQKELAKKLLISTIEKYPNSTLVTILQQINNDQLNPETFTSANMQLHAISNTTQLQKRNFLTTGIVVDKETIVTSRLSLANNKNFSIRDSLGHVFKAHLVKSFTDTYLAKLTIENFVASPAAIDMVDKKTFPGTPVYTIGFYDAQPNWPRLDIDILGSPIEKHEQLYSLNIQALDYGTGLYSLSGSLLGVVIDDGSRIRKVRMLSAQNKKNNSLKISPVRLPVDQVYETALKITVQIFNDN